MCVLYVYCMFVCVCILVHTYVYKYRRTYQGYIHPIIYKLVDHGSIHMLDAHLCLQIDIMDGGPGDPQRVLRAAEPMIRRHAINLAEGTNWARKPYIAGQKLFVQGFSVVFRFKLSVQAYSPKTGLALLPFLGVGGLGWGGEVNVRLHLHTYLMLRCRRI